MLRRVASQHPLAALAALCAGSAGVGAGVLILLQRRHCRRSVDQSEVYELKGEYYQLLGHAWDHETKDFKVIYRPLYHCPSASGRFEAHVLASSHFERWDTRFKRVPVESLPPAARRLVLPGPFVLDDEWEYATRTAPVPAAARTRSGLGARSHEPVLLEHLLGDACAFLESVVRALKERGCDVHTARYPLSHICYRTTSALEYATLLEALACVSGRLLSERMVGGRPVAVLELHSPVRHVGLKLDVIELSFPRAGRPYASGLEHAAFVVGTSEDGPVGNAALRRFERRHPQLRGHLWDRDGLEGTPASPPGKPASLPGAPSTVATAAQLGDAASSPWHVVRSSEADGSQPLDDAAAADVGSDSPVRSTSFTLHAGLGVQLRGETGEVGALAAKFHKCAAPLDPPPAMAPGAVCGPQS